MSALIKLSASAMPSIRAFGLPDPPSDMTEIALVDPEAPLKLRIEELEAQLDELAKAGEKAVEESRKLGAQDALAQRSELETKKLDALKAALESLDKSWSERLQSWNSLAIGVARTVLEQVFADADSKDDLLRAAVQHRLGRVDAETVLRVRVSASDFANEDALAVIGGVAEVTADPKLESGACFIDLKLGTIDVGLGTQWLRIAELLDRLEQERLET